MSGYRAFENNRRGFIKNLSGLSLFFLARPLKNINIVEETPNNTMQILRKKDQMNGAIFNGNFIVNKPVVNGYGANVAPYSNLFYWSHSRAIEDCQFPLHPHEGFEIMTFILEGSVQHYDTATKVWTPLEEGDFQVINANKGIEHSEKMLKNGRAFQIWFDPNFRKAVQLAPSYKDYRATDFKPLVADGLSVTAYIGGNSTAKSSTEGLAIKKIGFEKTGTFSMPLNTESIYTFYVLEGSIEVDNQELVIDDAFRLTDKKQVSLTTNNPLTQLFVIEVPKQNAYKSIWE